jgi:hypothetical protein
MSEANPEPAPPPVGSPPAAHTPGADGETDAVRRRLFELRTALTERFDRAGWDEYVRLRRIARITS